ncbi:hypothetical protein DE146DRAFT_675190 [Phaeosphaeria sp. MPI-PUGE-AT-0046c]|nr:hypothetical protein DE146DRAFT_675190 [Phaeosphaeria sp. MPI-PUGE-AT-0046c]
MIGAPVRNRTLLGTLTTLIVGVNQIGLGRDIWTLPFDNITKTLEIFYFAELFYLTAVGLTKISVLLFYLRIFPRRSLRRAIWVTITVCVLYIIAFVTTTALQCIPVRISWEQWDGEHHGKCLSLSAVGWSSAAINIVLDLVVMVIPIREVKNLSISRVRKFGVMLMFLGGLFVTTVSILRMEYLTQFAHTQNPTWDYLAVGYWSAVETHVGVIVACLPAIRSLQRAIFDRIWPKPPNSTGYFTTGTGNSSKNNMDNGTKSRTWLSKQGVSRLNTVNRSKVDKEDFVRLDELELSARENAERAAANDKDLFQTCSESSLVRSPSPGPHFLTSAVPEARGARPLDGILPQQMMDKREKRRFRLR